MRYGSVSEALRSAFASAERVLLTGPIDPDGDSIGACLALARGVRALGGAKVEVAGTPSFRYTWMPGADQMVPDAEVAGRYDLVVVLDGDRLRLEPPVEAAFRAAGARAIIDHHLSTEREGYELALLDPEAASTCEMVYALLDAWGVPLDAELASLLYTGVIFDTGGFRYSNTRPSTHRLAATLLETGLDPAAITVRVLVERRRSGLRLLGKVLNEVLFLDEGRVALGRVSLEDLREFQAQPGDLEGIVENLVFTTGVEVACLVVEKGPQRVRLSLRSRAAVHVAQLARALAPGGGGHARAAGVLLTDSLDTVFMKIQPALCAAVRDAGL